MNHELMCAFIALHCEFYKYPVAARYKKAYLSDEWQNILTISIKRRKRNE
jgi:hypothetical protein